MVNVYVLNPETFEIEGIVDSYVSLIWRPSYYDVGDFELYMGAKLEVFNLFKQGRYLVRDVDITVDNGAITYKNVMIVKNLDLFTDVENGDFVSITGRELKFLFHSRIVWNQTSISGNVESAIRSLVTENAINPSNVNRKIPNLSLDEVVGVPYTLDMQITGGYLDESITSICTNYLLGWEVYITNNELKFRVYEGADRSYGQTGNPYVVFSDTFENLYNTEYQMHSESYANCTLVGGEGEGIERIYQVVGDEYSGLERFEFFTDARDLSRNAGTEEEINEADYFKMLQERGKEKIAEMSVTEGFSGEVLSDVAFQYNKDFFIGDIVTVINKYGISRNVLVLSAIESSDENGTKLIPQFNI